MKREVHMRSGKSSILVALVLVVVAQLGRVAPSRAGEYAFTIPLGATSFEVDLGMPGVEIEAVRFSAAGNAVNGVGQCSDCTVPNEPCRTWNIAADLELKLDSIEPRGLYAFWYLNQGPFALTGAPGGCYPSGTYGCPIELRNGRCRFSLSVVSTTGWWHCSGGVWDFDIGYQEVTPPQVNFDTAPTIVLVYRGPAADESQSWGRLKALYR